jgi:hypothetical protein
MAKLKSGTRIYGDATVDNKLQVTSGPVLVGTATSTGTASQSLQVTGGAYVSGNLGIGITTPTSTLHVVGNVIVSGIATATTFVGNLTGTATTATNLSDAANITTGTINSSRLSGTYGINVSYATTAGVSTVAQGLTGTPNITVGIATATTFVGNLTGTATTATNVIGGIGSLTQLQVTGISTFTNGPVLIGTATSTGTSGQILQIAGINSSVYIGGNLGIGTTNPTRTLSINGDVGIGRSIYDSTNSSGTTGQVLQSTVSGIGWTTFSGGATLNNTPSGILYPTMSATTVGTYSTAYTSSSALTFTATSGTLSATQFTSLSDATKKINIRPIENAIELTKQLNGVRFDWKHDNKPSIGVIAQEIEKVLPELVEENDGVKSVSYGNIIGLLIEAIKEQQLRIEKLEERLDA